MNELLLPLVSPDTPLPDVLWRMAKAKQQAVVVRRRNRLLLIKAGDVTRSMNAAVEAGVDPATVRVSKVVPRHEPTPVPPAWTAPLSLPGASLNEVLTGDGGSGGSTGGRDGIGSGLLRDELRALFDEHDQRYTAVPASDGLSRVVTSSERYAAKLDTLYTICKCAGPAPKVHSFTPDQLDVPGQCNYAHAVAVTCQAADG